MSEQKRSWLDLLAEAMPGCALRPGAAPEALRAAEETLGGPLPPELAELLLETNGVEFDGIEPVWPLERIVSSNVEFRSMEDFRDLYMPFDHLVFFGAFAGGDQSAYRRLPDQIDIYIWTHEDDSRTWIASRMEDYLEGVGSERIAF